MNKVPYLRRIARIKAGQSERNTLFKLPNGRIGGIPRNKVIDVLNDALDGRETPDTKLMLTAVAESSGRLAELLQAILRE